MYYLGLIDSHSSANYEIGTIIAITVVGINQVSRSTTVSDFERPEQE